MLNEKKIALMTKMAIYEQGEGKKSFPMSKYYRSDYLSLRLIYATIVVCGISAGCGNGCPGEF